VTGSTSGSSPLLFYPLTFHADGDEVVVARFGDDSYNVFPSDGAALLARLQQGATLEDAAAWYEESFGDAVDVDEFVVTLHELGYVRSLGGEEAGAAAGLAGTAAAAMDADAMDADAMNADAGEAVRWRRLGRAIFSWPAALVWLGLVVAAIVAGALDHNVVPTHRDVFFSRSLVLIELTIIAGQLPLTIIHELAHLLAGRRLGVASRIRVAHRFTVVVFETVLDGLVMVPRRQRYLPLLAGMLADVVVMGVLVDVAWLIGPGVAAQVCLALAFTTLPRILWQFFVFLRTDVYYLLATALRCDDLDGAGRDVLRTWYRRHRGRLDGRLGSVPVAVPQDRWAARDWRAGRYFAPLLVAGYAAMLGTLVGLVGPLTLRFVERTIDALRGGGAWRWDAAAVLGLNLAQPVAARALAWKARRDARRVPSGAGPVQPVHTIHPVQPVHPVHP
jgi:hypothetical protein